MKKGIVSIFLILLTILGIINVKAVTKKIELTEISIEDKSNTISVDDPVISTGMITSNIVFNKLDDYVEFNLKLKNNELEKVKLESVSDNLENDNIKIDYTFDNDSYIETNQFIILKVKMTYNKQLINEDKVINDLKITLNLITETGKDYSSDIIINPETSFNKKNIVHRETNLKLLAFLIVGMVLLLGLLQICKKYQKLKVISILVVIGLTIIPFITSAEEKYESMIQYSRIIIKGEFEEFSVTFDTDGGSQIDEQTIRYGEKVTRPVADPVKESLKFVNWYKDASYQEEFDFDQAITSDTTIYAYFRDPCGGFSTDSWNTIASNVANDTAYYGLGCERDVDLGSFGVHKVRVANNTMPNECTTDGFSESACGFVLEFSEIIAIYKVNPYDQSGLVDGDGNKGGWEHSEVRSYLNSTLYDAFPSDLKQIVADTRVVSSHGSKDFSNFITNDKLYLLSTKELWGKDGTTNINVYDNAELETRQLDYYKDKGVTTDENTYSPAIKNYNGSPSYWWLRSAISTNNTDFCFAMHNGNWRSTFSFSVYGISPAFKIQ